MARCLCDPTAKRSLGTIVAACWLLFACKNDPITAGDPAPTKTFVPGAAPPIVAPTATATAIAAPTVVDDGRVSGVVAARIPYLYQYANTIEPGGTCGMTSITMVLHAFGEAMPVDDNTRRFGKAKAQTPAGVGEILRSFGFEVESTTRGSRAALKAHLALGKVAIVHGNWTPSGHIMVFRGAKPEGWWANDPAGDWKKCYECSARGEGVLYPMSGEFDDKLSHDGDIYFTLVKGRPKK